MQQRLLSLRRALISKGMEMIGHIVTGGAAETGRGHEGEPGTRTSIGTDHGLVTDDGGG